MKIAYILFNEITLLDFIGVYDPIKNIKTKGFIENLSWELCATTKTIADSFGLKINIDKIKPDLSNYDMVIVPGGYGTRKLQRDTEFIDWLKTAKNVEYLVSVCTGSLLLGAAGFLKGKMATTNFNEYKALEKYCDNVIEHRLVDDNNTITAGAVATALDLGLYLCKKLIGDEKAEEIRKGMDYHPKNFKIIVK
jgi:cyclohexyl-isocyanide hydratase